MSEDLPLRDKVHLVRALAALTWVSLQLRLVKPGRVVALLGAPTEPGTAADVPERAVIDGRRIGWAVAAVARRLPWHPTCLRQALAATRLLHRAGVPSLLVLGVQRPMTPSAHAWVTVGDVVVVGQPGYRSFTPLAAFTAGGPGLSGAAPSEAVGAISLLVHQKD